MKKKMNQGEIASNEIMKENSSNKGIEISPEFEDLFELSEKEEIAHEARMIMFRFLSEVEIITNQERGLKKRLADIINKSQSFITQLFNGDKIINLVTLAKIQKALNIRFEVKAYHIDSSFSTSSFPPLQISYHNRYEASAVSTPDKTIQQGMVVNMPAKEYHVGIVAESETVHHTPPFASNL